MAGCCLSLYDLMQSCARGEAGRLSQAKVRHEASSRTRSLVLDILLRAAGAGLIPRFAAASGDSLRPRRTSCKGDVHSSQAFGVSRSRLSWRGKALDASCSAAGFCAPTTVFPLGLPPQMSSRSILSNQFSVQLSSFLSCTCGAGPLEAQKSSFPLSFPTIAPICPGPAGCEPPAPHAPAARPRVRAGRVERVARERLFLFYVYSYSVFSQTCRRDLHRQNPNPFLDFPHGFFARPSQKEPYGHSWHVCGNAHSIPSVTQAGGQSTRLFFSHLICQQPFFFSRGLSSSLLRQV